MRPPSSWPGRSLLQRIAGLVRRRTDDRRICGICLIKDSVDLVPYLCGHYLRIGFDRLVFVDDSSTDGTFDALSLMARADARVVVVRSTDPVLRQQRIMNEAANAALAEGYRIVFPFDADEFWHVDAAWVRGQAKRPGVFIGRWVNFVQDRDVAACDRRSLPRARHHAPDMPNTTAEAILRYERAFLTLGTAKIGFCSDQPVDIAIGQHSLIRGPERVLAQGLEVFHLPFRAAETIRRRGEQATRVLQLAKPGEHVQSHLFAEALRFGELDRAWAANSASADGFIDLPGARVPLVEDARLATLLTDALDYLQQRYPQELAAMPQASVPHREPAFADHPG